MLFNSYGFIFAFLPVLLVGYYTITYMPFADTGKARRWFLLAMSLVFYGTFGIKAFTLLFVSAAISYVLCRLMQRMEKERFGIFLAALIFQLGLLFFFKYAGLFSERLGGYALPIAISFYTFQNISFVVDLYRGEIKEFSFLDYALYISFFPKLLQGPITSYADLKKEFDHCGDTRFSSEAVYRGLLLFSLGLWKKVILADTLGRGADYAFTNIYTLTQLEAALGAVAYSLQLYFDFSGYCDMARGICRMIGMDLPLNFDLPYRARNILDFWKRWHITLTKFFTKYVYIPLGGNRKGKVRLYINVLIVFVLSGIWHGAGLTFLIWGLMHGLLSVLTRMVGGAFGRSKGEYLLPGRIGHAIAVILTDIYVMCAWVFFRAASVSDALEMLRRIFQKPWLRLNYGFIGSFQLDEIWYVFKALKLSNLPHSNTFCMWIVITVAVILSVFGISGINAQQYALERKISVKQALFAAIFFVWATISMTGVSTFLYLNF